MKDEQNSKQILVLQLNPGNIGGRHIHILLSLLSSLVQLVLEDADNICPSASELEALFQDEHPALFWDEHPVLFQDEHPIHNCYWLL